MPKRHPFYQASNKNPSRSAAANVICANNNLRVSIKIVQIIKQIDTVCKSTPNYENQILRANQSNYNQIAYRILERSAINERIYLHNGINYP